MAQPLSDSMPTHQIVVAGACIFSGALLPVVARLVASLNYGIAWFGALFPHPFALLIAIILNLMPFLYLSRCYARRRLPLAMTWLCWAPASALVAHAYYIEPGNDALTGVMFFMIPLYVGVGVFVVVVLMSLPRVLKKLVTFRN